ncbi:MAG: site-specific DNA-methyltransferase [Sphingomonadaceae bacterium]|jgi:DNA modification methylase
MTISQSLAGSVPADALMADTIRVELEAIVQRAPAELKAFPNTPRKHSQKQITQMIGSLRRFGATRPVLITPDDEIVCGHAVVEAARQMKLPTIPTICITEMSEAEIRAYRIADNKLGEGSSWDLSVLGEELSVIIEDEEGILGLEALGFEIAEAEVILEGIAEPQRDAAETVPAPKAVAITRVGDIWVLGEHKLFCGSCLDSQSWELLMGAEKGNVAFCDPPYNVPVAGHVSGLGKKVHSEFAMASGEMSSEEFIAFNRDWLEKTTAHMTNGAVIAACMDWRHIFELESAIRAIGLERLNLCVWNKTNGGMSSLWRSKHELVYIAKVGTAPHINNVQLGRFGRYRTNVWDYAGANSFGKSRDADLADHPTVKPIAMVADYLRDVSHRGQIVLDPFMGSGTTLLAAERTGRVARGIEIDPVYVDVAIRRWEEMTGNEASLMNDGRSFADIRIERLAEAGLLSEEGGDDAAE